MRYDELMETASQKMKDQGIFERWSFYGAETGYTRVTNCEFFKTIGLKLRTIDATLADTRTVLFGQELSTPIIAGAMSNPGLKEIPDALQCWAKGMKDAGSMMGVGITSANIFTEVMKIGVPTYRISKPFQDRQKIVTEMKEAEELDAVAVGIDIDFGLGNKMGHKPFYIGEMAPLSFAELVDKDDIEEAVGRTKEDDIFALTNALSEKNQLAALEALKNLLDQGIHHLMILTMIVREIRFLLQARILVDAGKLPAFKNNMEYGWFQKNVYPALSELKDSMVNLSGLLFSQHPFVIYNAWRNCGRFPYPGLVNFLDELLELDRAFKSSATDPQLLLESFLIKACAKL